MNGYEIPTLGLGGTVRDKYGLTCTIRHQQTGQFDTLVETGQIVDALTSLCEQIDRRDGPWLIVSLSTPASIYRDLQGLRESGSDPGGTKKSTSDPRTTEQSMLGRVGRLDLLQPLRQPSYDLGASRLA